MPGWNFKNIPSPMHNFVIDAGDLYIKLCNFCCLVSSVILASLIRLCNLYLSEQLLYLIFVLLVSSDYTQSMKLTTNIK